MGKFQDLMDRELRIRGLAENTRASYLEKMRCFVRHFMRPPDQLTAEDVKQYQLFLTKERRVSWSTFNIHVCAIRFFYRACAPGLVGRRADPVSAHRQAAAGGAQRRGGGRALRRGDQPQAPRHPHDALRGRSSRQRGRPPAARRHRQQAHDDPRRPGQGSQGPLRHAVRQAPRDPAPLLAAAATRPVALPRPGPGAPLTRGSIDHFFAAPKQRAGIGKPVSPHSLRHSFATHLLERGVNIRVIQRLLGHRSLRSTEIYTHVAQSYVRDTKSPLDDLLPEVEDADAAGGLSRAGRAGPAGPPGVGGRLPEPWPAAQRPERRSSAAWPPRSRAAARRRSAATSGSATAAAGTTRSPTTPAATGTVPSARASRACAGRRRGLRICLPVPYFHLVFTIPDALHRVFLAHPRVAYGLLFAAVEKTVKEVAANPRNLGRADRYDRRPAHLDPDPALPSRTSTASCPAAAWTRAATVDPDAGELLPRGPHPLHGLPRQAPRRARAPPSPPGRSRPPSAAAPMSRGSCAKPRATSGSSTASAPSPAPSRSWPTSAATPIASRSPTSASSRCDGDR